MEQLERYAEHLRANIASYEKAIESVVELLHVQEKYLITDYGGEEEIRDDLRNLGKRLDRDREYLKAIEARLG